MEELDEVSMASDILGQLRLSSRLFSLLLPCGCIFCEVLLSVGMTFLTGGVIFFDQGCAQNPAYPPGLSDNALLLCSPYILISECLHY